jgi:hypothetical protein
MWHAGQSAPREHPTRGARRAQRGHFCDAEQLHIIVNGQGLLEDGRHTGALPDIVRDTWPYPLLPGRGQVC